MTDMVDIDPQRITRVMRDNIESLSSTSDMIDVLLAEAEKNLRELQNHFESAGRDRFGDWRTISTFLRLAAAQNDIVKETADAFNAERIQVAA